LVSSSSFAKLCRMALSTSAKARYLLGFSAAWGLLPLRASACGGAGVGYRNVALCEWEAMTATSFALPDARWALTKTSMFASAAGRHQPAHGGWSRRLCSCRQCALPRGVEGAGNLHVTAGRDDVKLVDRAPSRLHVLHTGCVISI
jgi:hypothetical protein